MLAVASEDPAVGLVFARRRIALGEHHGEVDVEWSRTYADVHEGFDDLERINDGRALFRQLLDAKFETNWVGEPTSVLMSRTCLATVGLFNPHLKQIMDLELWCRAMLGYRIGFVDQVLSTYLHHGDSLTDENARLARGWLDRLWLFESLLSCDLDPSGRREDRPPPAHRGSRGAHRPGEEDRPAAFLGRARRLCGLSALGCRGRAPGIHPALSETELRPSG